MKKRYIVSLLGALASAGVGYYLKNKNEGASTQNQIVDPMVNAGIPDQVDNYEEAQLENSKMVSEGSQFGVNYFNEIAEEIQDDIYNKMTD